MSGFILQPRLISSISRTLGMAEISLDLASSFKRMEGVAYYAIAMPVDTSGMRLKKSIFITGYFSLYLKLKMNLILGLYSFQLNRNGCAP